MIKYILILLNTISDNIKSRDFIPLDHFINLIHQYYTNSNIIIPDITEKPIEKDSLEDLIIRIKKLGNEQLGMDIHVLIQPKIK